MIIENLEKLREKISEVLEEWNNVNRDFNGTLRELIIYEILVYKNE